MKTCFRSDSTWHGVLVRTNHGESAGNLGKDLLATICSTQVSHGNLLTENPMGVMLAIGNSRGTPRPEEQALGSNPSWHVVEGQNVFFSNSHLAEGYGNA
jgi:hypothetical protein